MPMLNTQVLWPTKVAIIHSACETSQMHKQAVLSAGLEDGLLNAEERRVHDILNSFPACRQNIVDHIARYIGDSFDAMEPELSSRAIVFQDRAFINTHVDSREGDVTAVLFLTGNGGKEGIEGDDGQPVNSVGNPRFVLEDPSRYFDQARLPFESRHGYSINPKPGLMVIFPSHIPHNMHPYMGNSPHTQIVINIKFNQLIDLEQEPKRVSK